MSFNTDPNEIKTCPFDSSHKIAAYRFQNHVIKCKRSHPELVRQSKQCPFNALHFVSEIEYNEHLLVCPDADRELKRITKNIEVEKNKPPTPPVVRPEEKKTVIIPDEEDWDEEEPKVAIKIEDHEIKIEKLETPVDIRPSTSNKRTERRDDNDDEDDHERKRSKKPMGRGILQRR